MASLTQVTRGRRRNTLKRAGKKRKRRMSQKSTQSYEELFAGMGEPGSPASKSAAPRALSHK